MEIAHDSYRRSIRADDAERGGRYACPRCGVRVVLARGRIQADHFRHVGRTPAERKRARECELFVASLGGGGHGAATNGNEPPVKPSVQLYASWFDRDGQLGWALHLVIPPPAGGTHFPYFRVDEDAQSRGPRNSPFEQLSLRRFLIRARPGSYHVRAFSRDGQVVWCPPSTAQLRADCPNIFEVSSTGGFMLDADEALVPGRTYLVLNHKACPLSAPPEIPFPELGKSQVCDPGAIWTGHLLFLPAFAPDELERWCLETLDRCLAEPPASLELVCPPAIERANGVLVIEDRSAIILFLGTGWPETGSVIELTFPGGYSPDCPLPRPARFHRLSTSNRGNYEVHVRDNSQAISQCFLVVAPSVPQIAGVKLVVTCPGTDKVEPVDLLDTRAGEVWNAIITKSATFHCVELPDGWTVDLFWRRQDDQPEQRLTLDGIQFIKALNSCLDSEPRHARLDAGPFGTVEWNAPVASSIPLTSVGLPDTLDARLRWLLQAGRSSSVVRGERLPIKVRASDLTRLTDASQPTVKSFLDVAQWSPALLPQARSAAWDLAKLLDGEY
jgi:hypothetical protein